jgi:hypothetical protein
MGFELPVVPLAAPKAEHRPDSAAEFDVQAVKKEEMRHAHDENGQRGQTLAEDRRAPAQPEQDQTRRR